MPGVPRTQGLFQDWAGDLVRPVRYKERFDGRSGERTVLFLRERFVEQTSLFLRTLPGLELWQSPCYQPKNRAALKED